MTAIERLKQPQLATAEHADKFLRIMAIAQRDPWRAKVEFDAHVAKCSGLTGDGPCAWALKCLKMGGPVRSSWRQSQDMRQYIDAHPQELAKLTKASEAVDKHKAGAVGKAPAAIEAVMRAYAEMVTESAVINSGDFGRNTYYAQKTALRRVVAEAIGR